MHILNTFARLLAAALLAIMLPISAVAQEENFPPEMLTDVQDVVELLELMSLDDTVCFDAQRLDPYLPSYSIAGLHFYGTFDDYENAIRQAMGFGLCVHHFGFIAEVVNPQTGALIKWRVTEGYSTWNIGGMIEDFPPNPYKDTFLRKQGDQAIEDAKAAFAAMDAFAKAEAN